MRQAPLALARAFIIGGLLCTGVLAPQSAAGNTSITAPHYKLIDVGTLGGPQADVDLPGTPITHSGAVLGVADTDIPNRNYPNFNPFGGGPNRVLTRAFTWKDGKLTDLSALPGNHSSAVFEINSHGVGAGWSETETIDAFTGWPAAHAVLFTEGRVFDLGTLPGGYESFATAINDRGQVAGFGTNRIADHYAGSSFFDNADWTTQVRSFIWQNGTMRDIGTLGGNDALMNTLNARGQITGASFTNATPNETTGIPTLHPFLWRNGRIRDLGTLGGTYGVANSLNDSGQVAGQSYLAGDQTSHPFLSDGQRLRDLGTLGGDFGSANYINNTGHVVGWATTPSNTTAHAFLWKRGAMTDLTGAARSHCTVAEQINARDEIVGHDCDETSALLWIDGKQYDLNAVIGPSAAHLTNAVYAGDQGQIVAIGYQADGSRRVFLLNPDGWRFRAHANISRPRQGAISSPTRWGISSRRSRSPARRVPARRWAPRTSGPARRGARLHGGDFRGQTGHWSWSILCRALGG
jgi:probable HAF family extracellular repeat protein